MKVSMLILSMVIFLVVLATVEAGGKPCRVDDCSKCNKSGRKCKVCNEGFQVKPGGKWCNIVVVESACEEDPSFGCPGAKAAGMCGKDPYVTSMCCQTCA